MELEGGSAPTQDEQEQKRTHNGNDHGADAPRRLEKKANIESIGIGVACGWAFLEAARLQLEP